MAARLAAVSAGFITFGLEEITHETKEKTAELVTKANPASSVRRQLHLFEHMNV